MSQASCEIERLETGTLEAHTLWKGATQYSPRPWFINRDAIHPPREELRQRTPPGWTLPQSPTHPFSVKLLPPWDKGRDIASVPKLDPA